jgi:hypothetical protein
VIIALAVGEVNENNPELKEELGKLKEEKLI